MKFTVTVPTESGDQYHTFEGYPTVDEDGALRIIRNQVIAAIFPKHYWTKVILVEEE